MTLKQSSVAWNHHKLSILIAQQPYTSLHMQASSAPPHLKQGAPCCRCSCIKALRLLKEMLFAEARGHANLTRAVLLGWPSADRIDHAPFGICCSEHSRGTLQAGAVSEASASIGGNRDGRRCHELERRTVTSCGRCLHIDYHSRVQDADMPLIVQAFEAGVLLYSITLSFCLDTTAYT